MAVFATLIILGTLVAYLLDGRAQPKEVFAVLGIEVLALVLIAQVF